jgi:hypothetical protein
MNDRIYRAIIGLLILLALYFESGPFLYALVVVMFIEGLTNWRLPKFFCYVCKCVSSRSNGIEYVMDNGNPDYRFYFEAERVWRFNVAFFLLLGWLLYEHLWFLPWFLGFAIFGAGLSGVCPMLLVIRWAGFR